MAEWSAPGGCPSHVDSDRGALLSIMSQDQSPSLFVLPKKRGKTSAIDRTGKEHIFPRQSLTFPRPDAFIYNASSCPSLSPETPKQASTEMYYAWLNVTVIADLRKATDNSILKDESVLITGDISGIGALRASRFAYNEENCHDSVHQ